MFIDITNPIEFSVYEIDKDNKDLGYYAFNYFANYMNNILRCNKFWVNSNKIYNKKFNLNQDISMWEAWRIEARAYVPNLMNVICIIMRRKFLYPFYGTFQCFHLIIYENITREKFEIQPHSNEVLELVADSMHFVGLYNQKEYIDLIKAKIDSLLFDEETSLFFLNTLDVLAEEVFSIAYEFVYSILALLEINNPKEKSKIGPCRHLVENKIRALNQKEEINLRLDSINTSNIMILSIVKKMINLKETKLNIDSQDENDNESNNEKEDEEKTNNNIETNNDFKQEMNEYLNNKGKNKNISSFIHKNNWRRKCLRFLAFCLNGGLTDYTFNFENFIDMVSKLPSGNLFNDFNDYIVMSIDIFLINSKGNNQVEISFLNEASEFTFNEDVLCACIKTGWISKHLRASVKYTPMFLKILIDKHCTNKILNAIYLYIKLLNDTLDDDSTNEERTSLNIIIPSIVKVYSDIRKLPQTLIIAAKCLCLLVCKQTDKMSKKILIQEDIVAKISNFLQNYEYDLNLMITSLELFSYIMPELKSKINDYLLDNGGVNILNNLKAILLSTNSPGCFYPQRVSFYLYSGFNRSHNNNIKNEQYH